MEKGLSAVNPWSFSEQTENINASTQQFFKYNGFQNDASHLRQTLQKGNAIKNNENKMLIIKKGLPYFSKDRLEKLKSKDILLNILISTCTPTPANATEHFPSPSLPFHV